MAVNRHNLLFVEMHHVSWEHKINNVILLVDFAHVAVQRWNQALIRQKENLFIPAGFLQAKTHLKS